MSKLPVTIPAPRFTRPHGRGCEETWTGDRTSGNGGQPMIATHEKPAPVTAPTAATRRDIRLVALDVDGTLLRTDKRLSLRTVRAVEMARHKGVHVILASARPPRSLREIHHLLGLQTPQVNYNGALIHDRQRNRHVFHQPLSQDVARRVVRLARKIEPRTVVSIEILDKWYTDHVDPDLSTETSKRFTPDFVGPLEAFLRVPVTKLMLLAAPERMGRITQAVRRKFQGKVALAVSDPHVLQIIHPQVDKSRALAKIAAELNVPREQVMAVGDAPNDVGMLQWSGLGVAVQNAWEPARLAADCTVPSNDQDGVAHAIERYVI